MSELTLRLFLEWGIIAEAEYLERMYPEPSCSYEELEATNWSPEEIGF